MRETCISGVIALASVGGWLVNTVAEDKSDPPNLIFLLTDDLGYSDINCYGAKTAKTSHLNRFAVEGIMFTDFHTAASICSPSGAVFLTAA